MMEVADEASFFNKPMDHVYLQQQMGVSEF